MLVDAILQKIYHLPPEVILRDFLVVCAIVGVAASFAPSLLFHFLEHTPKARARNKREMNAELLRKYDEAGRRLHEAHDRETLLRKENHELRRLIAAETNWGRNHRADVQATIGGLRR